MAEESANFRRRSLPGSLGNPVQTVPPVQGEVEVEPQILSSSSKPTYDPKLLAPLKGNPWLFEFAFDSHSLTAKHRATLDSVADYLSRNPKSKLQIEGHTDNVGGAQYNLILSKRRAEGVRDFLKAKGVPESRLSIAYYGFERPIQSNAAEKGRAHNRRVELILLKQ